MTRSRFLICLAAGALGFLALAAHAQDNADLATQAKAVFKKHCAECHHGPGSEGGEFDALKDATMTAKRTEGEKPYIVPGKPDESFILKRIESNKMPPKDVKDRPTDADKAIVRKWIAAGSPAFPKVETRQFVSQKAVLAAVRDHLRKIEPEDRPFMRYFTLNHLHNNSEVGLNDLAIQRAALSKAINSLSWKPRIVIPTALDKDETVFAIDLRDVDWDKGDLWKEIMKAYPYGLRFDDQADTELRDMAREVERETNVSIAVVRADWFVATATRPPLYYTLLDLPKNAVELEKTLRVDSLDDIRRDRVARAGFHSSGVSAQNRLVERHEALHGAYWKSYDFKPGKKKGDLTQFPLGPVFRGNPFEQLAFEHDGGEMIFHLPNGLQGYFLVDGKDNRIDQGPEDVVFDKQQTSGSPAIVNGQSCMACHSKGVIDNFQDEIRDGSGVFGDAKRKVRRIYPEKKSMTALLAEDRERFLKALEVTVNPFLKKKDFSEIEVIGEVIRPYRLRDLDLATVAAELDIANPEELKSAIAGNPNLQRMGLAPLLNKGVVKRREWESGGRSLLQRVAVELGKGSPIRED